MSSSAALAETAAADPNSGPAARAFEVGDLIRIVEARKSLIRRVAIGVIVLTLLMLLLLPTLYSTSAEVLLDQRKNNVTDQSAVLSALPTDAASLQNQIQILTSRDLAAEVIANLHLDRDPEFNASLDPNPLANWRALLNPARWPTLFVRPDPNSPAQRDATIDAFQRLESVDVLGLSTTIAVTFSSRDPQKAATITNAIVATYVLEQLDLKRETARTTTHWLQTRIHQLALQVQAAEAATQKYKADNNLAEAGDGTPLVDQQASAISTQLVVARSDLAEKQAMYSHIESLVQSGHAADVSQVVASPLIIQLRQQEAQVIREEADLSTRYGPRHPKLIAVEQQKRDLADKLAQEVDRIAGSMANDVSVARAQVGSLSGSLQQTEKQAGSQNLARVKLKALEANATSTRTMYEAFVSRLRETQDQDSIQMSDARVISRAPVPIAPSSPHRLLILGASIPGGLLLGLLLALLAERFGFAAAAPRARVVFPQFTQAPTAIPYPPPQPVDPFRGAPVLAEIPDAVPVQSANYVLDFPASGYAQGMASLLARIDAMPRGQGAKVIAVTSAQAGEGKTTIAVSLARAATQRGMRAIVLDGNLHAPTAAAMMGLAPARAGLVEALSGAAPLSHCLLKDRRSNAFVLSAAQPRAEARDVLASPVMARMMAALRQSYDLVVLDATPVIGAADTPYLLRYADATLMVARWNGQPREAVSYAIGALAQMHAPSVGVVLTR